MTLLYSAGKIVQKRLSAGGGQLFCQQTAKKSLMEMEIYRKMLMLFTGG